MPIEKGPFTGGVDIIIFDIHKPCAKSAEWWLIINIMSYATQ